jgi:Family of unknown function (DUF6159)
VSRVRRGFKLAGVSWRVIVAEPAILAVLAVGLVGMVILSGGLFLLLFRRFPMADDFQFPNYLVALPVLWLGSIVTTYCNVVVSVMADRRLRGDDATVADGMSVASAKLNRIVSWTMVSIAVGLLLQLIAERFRLAGVIAARLFGMAWNLATMFVIPVIALEDRPVRDSIRRSASIFKSKWGESVVAQGTIGLAVMFAAFPAMFVVLLCAAISVPLAITVGVVLIGSLMLVSGALDAVVDVALYRYAMDGTVLGAFTAEDLDGTFQPKRREL